jgi:NAD+ synthase (glutamine-hydrolysing)
MYANGFIKVAAASPRIKAGDAMTNVKEILNLLSEFKSKKPSIVLFPELTICGYSVGDLHFQGYLYRDNLNALDYLLKNNPFSGIIILGTFFIKDDRIFNCAAVIQGDKILGIVPKSYLPHTNEFQENRWFVPGKGIVDQEINVLGKDIPFGQIVFTNLKDVSFGVEICEDYWEPFAPNDVLYGNGALMVFNPSASPEVIGKAETRTMLAKVASYKNRGAYIYTSCNSSDSTSEVVFSNHKMIYEIGAKIEDVNNINLKSDYIIGDIDLSRIHFMRRSSSYIKNTHGKIEQLPKIVFELTEDSEFVFEKGIDLFPFIPKTKDDFQKVIDIQATSVKKRLEYIGIENTILGVSGGLDSTIALLSLVHMCDIYDMDRKTIYGVVLPSLNTSSKTHENAKALIKKLGVNYLEMDINNDVNSQLKLINHSNEKDVTYENVQARFRTYTLMNLANMHNGIVIGTSDMSEVALGWSTFNGDQMAMYGINAGLPKTVIKSVGEFYIDKYPEVKDVLMSILSTPISPELSGNNQETESIIGKYEINDFILYHFLVNGDSEDRIEFLLNNFFKLNKNDSQNYVSNFFKRFYSQQYKRLTMPESAKVLKLSLSPRTETKLNGDLYRPSK